LTIDNLFVGLRPEAPKPRKLLTCFFGSFSSSGTARNGGHAPQSPESARRRQARRTDSFPFFDSSYIEGEGMNMFVWSQGQVEAAAIAGLISIVVALETIAAGIWRSWPNNGRPTNGPFWRSSSHSRHWSSRPPPPRCCRSSIRRRATSRRCSMRCSKRRCGCVTLPLGFSSLRRGIFPRGCIAGRATGACGISTPSLYGSSRKYVR